MNHYRSEYLCCLSRARRVLCDPCLSDGHARRLALLALRAAAHWRRLDAWRRDGDERLNEAITEVGR